MRVFGIHLDRLAVLLGLSELVLFGVVFAAALFLAGSYAGPGDGLVTAATGLALLLVIPLIATGAYRREAWQTRGVMLSRLATSGVLGLLLVLAADAALKTFWGVAIAPWHVLPAIAVALGGAAAARLAGRRLRFLTQALKARSLVLGAGNRAGDILDVVHRHRRVRLLGAVAAGSETVVAVPGERLLAATPAGLAALAGRLHATEIVVALDERRGALPTDELLNCRLNGITVMDATSFIERETGRIDLQRLHPSWLIFSDGFTKSRLAEAAKRAMDVLVATALLLFLAPVLALVAVAIRLDSKGPVLYRQKRVGEHGRIFEIVKFRSMVTDAERDGRARWAVAGDPRVTRVGRLIRRTRIDELPQALNVLKGEMSLVGPRPERPEFVAELARALPYYDFRHKARPGLTGWAQINYQYGASVDDAAVKLEYDLYYLKHLSFFLDTMILLQTARIVLSGEGAH